MFKHEKQLFHPVAVERPNPQYAGAACRNSWAEETEN